MKRIAERVGKELVNRGLLVALRDYLIFYLRRSNILMIPLPRARVLMLILNPIHSGEALADHMIELLVKLRGLSELDRDDPEEGDEESSSEIADIYTYFAHTLIESNLAMKTTIVRVDGVQYHYPQPVPLTKDLIEWFREMHRDVYPRLRYRSIRVVVGDHHVVILPLDENHIVLAEVDPRLTTKKLLSALALREL